MGAIRSLLDDVRTHGRHIVPVWLFPLYFLAWGFVCQWLRLPYGYVVVLFFVAVGPPFFGTFLWAAQVRKHLPYWRFCFLTIGVPFLIFAAVGLFLALGQVILEASPAH